MRPLTIYRLHSVFALLNSCCLASLLMSLFSLRVVFRSCHVLWRSFAPPVWFTRCFNRTMTEWLTLNRSAVCLYDIPPITIPAACHLSTSDSFRPVMLKYSLENLKFHLHFTCRYRLETPAKLEFCKGTGELIKTCFVIL